MVRESFTASDGKVLSLALWDKVAEPRGVVHIVHGMAEHIARYDDFACYLNSVGFIVAGLDIRAHGETDRDRLGLVGEGDLFEDTVRDLKELTASLKRRYGLPVVIMGHSYGSFLTQRYLAIGADDVAAAILSGSALMKGFAVNFGYRIAKGRMKNKRDEAGDLFAKLTFESYDKKFGEGIGGWLNRDIAAVGKYNADPLCGFTCSNGFYYYFFGGLKRINELKPAPMPEGFKIHLIAGGADCLGKGGDLVIKLAEKYKKQGAKVEVDIYGEARHEILNELNKEEAYYDVGHFLLGL